MLADIAAVSVTNCVHDKTKLEVLDEAQRYPARRPRQPCKYNVTWVLSFKTILTPPTLISCYDTLFNTKLYI